MPISFLFISRVYVHGNISVSCKPYKTYASLRIFSSFELDFRLPLKSSHSFSLPLSPSILGTLSVFIERDLISKTLNVEFKETLLIFETRL